MTRKCCLSCAYLCRLDDAGKRQSLTEQERSTRDPSEWGSIDDTFQIAHHSACYHDQWEARGSSGSVKDDLTNSYDFLSGDRKPGHVYVLLDNGKLLSLKNPTDCEFFNMFNADGTKPIDRIWQEHERAIIQQEKEEERELSNKRWIAGVSVTAFLAILGLLFSGGGTP